MSTFTVNTNDSVAVLQGYIVEVQAVDARAAKAATWLFVNYTNQGHGEVKVANRLIAIIEQGKYALIVKQALDLGYSG
jgi:tRNA1(Val) A37 N6-methylase TrmN6